MAIIGAQFAEADANGDGRLDMEEHLTYMRISNEHEQKQGKFIFTDADILAANYRIFNCVSAEEGYTLAEMMSVFGPVMAEWAVLDAAKAS